MLGYVYGHDEMVAQFVASLIPHLHGRGLPQASKAFGVVDEQGHLIAGMVYHEYQPEAGTIEMSGAALPGRQWLSRETIRRMYTYPFNQLGCQMVIMRVRADDLQLLRQLKALNYSFTVLPRLLGRDKDAVICLLTYEDWIASKFQKRFKHYLEAQPTAEAA